MKLLVLFNLFIFSLTIEYHPQLSINYDADKPQTTLLQGTQVKVYKSPAPTLTLDLLKSLVGDQEYDGLKLKNLKENDLTIVAIGVYHHIALVFKFEYAEICASDEVLNYYFRFDKSNILGDEVSSKITVTLEGITKDTKCDKNSRFWLNHKFPLEVTQKYFAAGVNFTSFRALLSLVSEYHKTFPEYNYLGVNSHHFATGLFNSVNSNHNLNLGNLFSTTWLKLLNLENEIKFRNETSLK